jgi:hypothetical protein
MRFSTIVAAGLLAVAPALAEEPPGFSGSFRGPAGEQWSIVIDGTTLRGSYSTRDGSGSFWGVLTGSLLSGWWSQSGRDAFSFNFRADDNGFSGSFERAPDRRARPGNPNGAHP